MSDQSANCTGQCHKCLEMSDVQLQLHMYAYVVIFYCMQRKLTVSMPTILDPLRKILFLPIHLTIPFTGL